ncbi:hypothetical protein O3M35_004762 [Rhynocoris fuscipes]|uniref:DUF4708 domain-containing protein n=1 Tax=Rhynocoris fuscipes TaxID=488301 RepID=A0AAW1DGM1_9HEMI
MQNLQNSECIFFAKLPNYNQLICLLLSLDLNEKKDRSVKTHFHWQILKSRMLIFSNENILVSPVLGSLTQIYVIGHKNIYQNDYVQNLLVKYNLKDYCEIKLSSDIFEACIKYTLLARLAPKWNIVGNLLVAGRDFLMRSDNYLSAVKCDIVANEREQVVISVSAYRVKLNRVSIDDFQDYTKIGSNNNTIYDFTHHQCRLNVLPSLKRGKVISVSETFPRNSCFKDYKELRRHWKNIYGYRLPEEAEKRGMLYIGIHFFGPTVYTYPGQCLTSSISVLPLLNSTQRNDTIMQFISDVIKVFPTVCQTPFIINTQYGYPVAQLISIKNESEIAKANWISKEESCSKNSSLRQNTDLATVCQEEVDISDAQTQDVPLSLCTQTQMTQDVNEVHSQPARIIPHFTNNKKATRPLDERPTFNNKTVSFPSSTIEGNPMKTEENSNNFQSIMRPIKPTFMKPKKVDIFKVLNTNQCDKQMTPRMNTSNNCFNGRQEVTISNKLNSSKDLNREKTNVNNSFINDKKDNSSVIFGWQTKPVFNKVSTHSVQNSMKRKEPANLIKSEILDRKVHKKKQINTDDIKQMATNGTLNKANISSLIDFLKENNITYKCKDKKADLIVKVLNHIKN